MAYILSEGETGNFIQFDSNTVAEKILSLQFGRLSIEVGSNMAIVISFGTS